jgi:hypothetical protein
MGLRKAIEDFEEPRLRDRPVGVFIVAALSAVAGIVVLADAAELFAGVAQFGDWAKPKLVGNDYVGMVQVYPEHYLLVGAILLAPAGYLLALAYGLLRARKWAWWLGLVAGGLVFAYGILALVIPAQASFDESVIVQERWYPAAGLPWIIIGGALVWYLRRRVVQYDLGLGDPAFS